jgi:hypothetical protein
MHSKCYRLKKRLIKSIFSFSDDQSAKFYADSKFVDTGSKMSGEKLEEKTLGKV